MRLDKPTLLNLSEQNVTSGVQARLRKPKYNCLRIQDITLYRPIIIMALQPFVGPWPFFSFLILYTFGMTP
jgi:hypothetical protein